jgi:divalent metal cation (Fe/Co/Zn/Cd) transporter
VTAVRWAAVTSVALAVAVVALVAGWPVLVAVAATGVAWWCQRRGWRALQGGR